MELTSKCKINDLLAINKRNIFLKEYIVNFNDLDRFKQLSVTGRFEKYRNFY
jgi:hypothetical protein